MEHWNCVQVCRATHHWGSFVVALDKFEALSRPNADLSTEPRPFLEWQSEIKSAAAKLPWLSATGGPSKVFPSNPNPTQSFSTFPGSEPISKPSRTSLEFAHPQLLQSILLLGERTDSVSELGQGKMGGFAKKQNSNEGGKQTPQELRHKRRWHYKQEVGLFATLTAPQGWETKRLTSEKTKANRSTFTIISDPMLICEECGNANLLENHKTPRHSACTHHTIDSGTLGFSFLAKLKLCAVWMHVGWPRLAIWESCEMVALPTKLMARRRGHEVSSIPDSTNSSPLTSDPFFSWHELWRTVRKQASNKQCRSRVYKYFVILRWMGSPSIPAPKVLERTNRHRHPSLVEQPGLCVWIRCSTIKTG